MKYYENYPVLSPNELADLAGLPGLENLAGARVCSDNSLILQFAENTYLTGEGLLALARFHDIDPAAVSVSWGEWGVEVAVYRRATSSSLNGVPEPTDAELEQIEDEELNWQRLVATA